MNIQIKKLILDLINGEGYLPITPAEMLGLICDGSFDESDFWRVVSTLEKNFEIVFTKKGKLASPAEMGIYKGVFSASGKGNFGFVTTEKGEFFIPPRFTMGAVYSDEVIIKKLDTSSRFFGKGNEAEVIKIIKRGIDTVVGTLTVYTNGIRPIGEVEPENERIHLKIRIQTKKLHGYNDGDKVICKIISFPENDYDYALGEIIEVLGKSDTLEANYKAILHSNGISTTFDDKVISDAEAVSKEKLTLAGRVDLRNETIFTIDSADAKDLDDAISLKEIEGGYILGVHIADVSHYVRANSSIDKEAIERGTSVYFTDKVVPMLPEALSNGACSLNGGVDRYALSCFVTLDSSGSIVSTELVSSVINSKVRGVYAELNDILEKNENSEFYQKYAHVIDDFYKMMELYKILKAKSEARGAMELESDEAKIILDKRGMPIDIVKRERGESERLIEQFMLCANEAVATYLYNMSMPCVYRVHDEPDREKIDTFAIFAKNLGVDVSPLRTKNTITPSQLSRVLKSSEEKGCSAIVSSVLLRSLMKAKYSSVQKAHFGLNTELYCHFTSPIRRYPDLSVHRIIKAILNGEITEKNFGTYEKFASLSADLSSENELKAIHAERDIEDLYMCAYMRERIGEEYEAVISSVTSFGFFAKTQNLCEGLVSIESLGGGFYFDKNAYTLARGKTVYRLGMRVKIRVKDADLALRQIDFELIDEKTRKNDEATEQIDGATQQSASYQGATQQSAREKRRQRVLDRIIADKKRHRKNRSRDTYRKRKR